MVEILVFCVYYHYMNDQTPEELQKNMRSLKRWIQGRLVEFDDVLKMKSDLEYYQHQTAQLMKRVEILEAKLFDSTR